MKLPVLPVLALVCLLSFKKSQSQSSPNIETASKQLDSLIEKEMNASGIVGIGAAIIVNKKIVWSKGYGYSDKANKKPFTTQTVMNIASISKNFMGVCLMKAVEEKKLSLDEDINKYLPFKVVNPYFPNEIITIRNLATHSSSLADRSPVYDNTYYTGTKAPEELGEFLKNYFDPKGKHYSKENFLDHKPGTYYQYSNIPAALAGYIIERVTGKKLGEYAKEKIFTPLKMTNTAWSLQEIDPTKHTKLYDKQTDTLKEIELYSGVTYPDGGVRTTVAELSKYFIALLNDGEYNGVRILKKESVQEMQRYQFNASNKPKNMNIEKLNYGIFWATKQGATKIGHAGTDPGVKIEMLSDLKKEVAVILFTNTGLTEKDLIKYHFGIYDHLCNFGNMLLKTGNY